MKKRSPKFNLQARIHARRSRVEFRRENEQRERMNGSSFPGNKKTSKIIDFLYLNLKAWDVSEKMNREFILPVPSIFSFIEHPNQALNLIYSTVKATRNRTAKKLTIDHSVCNHIDLCSSMLVDIVMMEFDRETTERRSKRKIGGYLSQNDHVNCILRSTGLLHNLKVKGQEAKPEIDRNFKKFDLVRGYRRKLTKHKSTLQEKTASGLMDYFDQCLEVYGFSLTSKGQGYIGNLAGEVIDNAERHSTQDNWWTVAYMEQDHERGYGRCHISFLSLGETFYESMLSLSHDSNLRGEIEELVDNHKNKYNLIPNSGLSEENLWTLYALQEGVSSSGHGGTGTISMIQTFQELGSTCDSGVTPQMAIVSGSTQIKFDGRYKLEKTMIHGKYRNIIAFNDSNSLEDRPDKKYVRQLKGFFPGSIISLSFYLDPKWLQQLAK